MSSPHTVYGCFDSQTRRFVAFTKNPPQYMPHLLTRIVCDVPDIKLDTLKWNGDYDTGSLQIIETKNKTIVDRRQLYQEQLEVFFKQYPIQDVIVNLLWQFSLLLPLLPPDQIDPNTKQMTEMYQRIYASYLNQLAFYANSPEHEVVRG